FQAEDGIRDFHVTGVQTCALPISGAEPRVYSAGRKRCNTSGPRSRERALKSSSSRPVLTRVLLSSNTEALSVRRLRTSTRSQTRSDERRVGTERRASGAASWYKCG